MVGLYPNILRNEGILALKNKSWEQTSSKIPTNDLVKLAEFLLKNIFFEFDSKIKQQISGTAIGTNFAPPCTCVYMNKTDIFLKRKSFTQLRYTDNIFFIWMPGEAGMKKFTKEPNEFLPNLKFTYESLKKYLIVNLMRLSLPNWIHLVLIKAP